MQDNIEKMIANLTEVKKESLIGHTREVFKEIKKAIRLNEDLLLKTSKLDEKRENGKALDFQIVENIFDNLSKQKLAYGDVVVSEKMDSENMIYGKEVMDIGTVAIIHNGDSYVLLEMILRNIMAGNGMLFINDGYMLGTNQLIIQICQEVLEKFSVSKNMMQMLITNQYDILFSHCANINLIVAIGDRVLQNHVLQKSPVKTITSGYENFDLYVEDDSNLDFIKKIIDSTPNIQVYVKEGIELDGEKIMTVMDIDEAIAEIEYNGSLYSAAIFTSSSKNASKFLKEVKYQQVVVNTSPTIERILDIRQQDLMIKKTIIYPIPFKK